MKFFIQPLVFTVILAFSLVFAQGTKAEPLECLQEHDNLNQHFHIYLSVGVVNVKSGERSDFVMSPEYFAGKDGCLLEIHAHDESGIIHVESKDKEKLFTLGDIFTIFEEGFGFKWKNYDGSPPLVYLGHDVVPSKVHRALVLEDKMGIFIFMKVNK